MMKRDFVFIPSWEECGQRKVSKPFVPTKSQHQKRLNVAGWVDPLSGNHGIIQNEKGNTDGFINTLRHILYRFKGTIIEIWVDNARWHKGKKVDDFLGEHKNVLRVPHS